MTGRNDPPRISVVMCAYNAQNELPAAIESILDQTFRDFEFIIINDGSTDKTGNVLEQYSKNDDRIRIFTHPNMGLTKSLNKALQHARGEFIARQDCDDWSHPERLQKQYVYINTHNNIALLGSASEDIYEDGSTRIWGAPPDAATLKNMVHFVTPFAHSSVMMRANALKALGGYDETFKTSQDAELWLRFAKNYEIAMHDEPLIKRHISPGSISKKRKYRQLTDALRARIKHARNPLDIVKIIYWSGRSFLLNLLPGKTVQIIKDYIAS